MMYLLYANYYHIMDINFNIICCGDFNAHIESYISYETNISGSILKDFIENTNL